MYIAAIEEYLGRNLKPQEVLLQDDGSGVYIKVWNVIEKPQPTVAQLEQMRDHIEPLIVYEQAKEAILEAQKEEHKKLMHVVSNQYVFDCTDSTTDSLKSIRDDLKNSVQETICISDRIGNEGLFTLAELEALLGELSLRRLNIHNQAMAMIDKALRSEPFEIVFI